MFLNGIQVRLFQLSLLRVKWVPRKFSSGPPLRNPRSLVELKEPLGELTDSCHVGEICSQPKIIIIGAGVAGLSAAQRLVQSGLNDITIIEGLNRFGGRVHTHDADGCKVDLGAQWVHGSTIGNPVFNIATQEGLIKQPLCVRDPYCGFYFTWEGIPIDSYVTTRAKKTFESIKQKAFTYYSKQPEYVNMSFWHYLLKAIYQELKKLNPNEQGFSQRVLLGLTNDLKSKFAADLSDITLGSLTHYRQTPGGDVPLTSGFSGILKPMMENLPENSIQYNKKVKLIRWYTGGDPRVEVYTTDGTTFTGDYVIVTVSLGVLKQSQSCLFNPVLPSNKIQAIDAIGFGHANKVFLQYNKPFWIQGEANIRPSWSYKEISNRDRWIHSIGAIEEAPCNKNMLVLEIGGTDAMYLETASAQEISQDVSSLIRKFAADNSLPEPKCVIKSSWSYDPLFLGAKSYLTKKTYPKHFKDLIVPLPAITTNAAPSLFMAGEATCYGYTGTVQGARISGIREADSIISLTRRFRGRPPPIVESVKDCNYCVF